MKKEYEFLDQINFPSDLKKIPERNLQKVADELREEMIDAVSVTGGHLGASLGVVELTVALHYIFDTPKDKLIWDVGHQCYPHKILTGRKDKMLTIRKYRGISGLIIKDGVITLKHPINGSVILTKILMKKKFESSF